MTVTLFSWGYWGWGNATERLVEAFDAAERARGFQPPVFVDVRLRRQGRAKGFVSRNFEKTVGPSRYEYIHGLGNRSIATGGSHIVIHQPKAVEDLLDLAFHCGHHDQRVIFFCACEYPRWCHRYRIASLALKKAETWGRPVRIVEWPGGNTKTVPLEIEQYLLKAVRNGRKSIPLRGQRVRRELAELSWGSILRLRAPDESLYVISGPARFSKGWVLPVIDEVDPSGDVSRVKRGAERFRNRCGFEPRNS
jgi:hypothetical protein